MRPIRRATALSLWTATLALLVAGILFRAWFVAKYAVVQNDSQLYAEIADNWLHNHIYGLSADTGQRPTYIRLPGYPAFLIASSFLFRPFVALGWLQPDSFFPALFFQCVLDLAGCLLLALTAGNLLRARFGQGAASKNNAVARQGFLLALGLACLCPFTVNYVATPLTEAPVLFTISLSLYALERWLHTQRIGTSPFNRYLFLLAAALSASIFFRPDQLLLAVAILPAVLLAAPEPPATITPLGDAIILPQGLESRMRRRMRWASDTAHSMRPKNLRPRLRIAAFVTCIALIALPFVPWTVRNWQTFHRFQPLTPKYAVDPGEPINTGFDRWYRTWAVDFTSTFEFYWNYPDTPIDANNLPDRAFDTDAQEDATERLIDQSNAAPHYHAEIDRAFGRLADERIHSDPIRYYLALPVARTLNMLLRPRVEILPVDLRWWRFGKHPAQTVFAFSYALLNLAFFLAAAIGLWSFRPLEPVTAAAVAYFLLRCLMLCTLDNAEQRYTIEFFPLLILAAALSVAPPRTVAE